MMREQATGAVGPIGHPPADPQISERRYRSVFDQAAVGMARVAPDGVFLEVNDRYCEITGYERDALLGRRFHDFTHPDDLASYVAGARALMRGEMTTFSMEKRCLTQGGATVWINLTASLIRNGPGEPTDFLAVVEDIDSRKHAESAVRQLNETLELRVADELAGRLKLEEALRQSQKMEAIGQLTGGVAHDFNNLLTVIRSSAGLLRRDDLPEARRRRYVDAIADTADRAAKLTGQLLAFARRQALKPEVFDVGERVERITDMLRTVTGAGVELVTETDCEICFVEADPSQLETALVNLAVNATDAMPEGGRLTVRVKPAERVPRVRGHEAAEGRFVAVEVADTGAGISDEALTHIFEPFFTTKPPGKGTGLGLSQVYGFAKQSGGEVDVASRDGEGAAFTLYLPRVSEPAPKVEQPLPDPASCPQRGHILVVEDNEQVGAFSTQMLTELGFQTSWAGNADVALKMLEGGRQRFHAVFSDVVMPGMSGIELACEIRRRMPGLPVVLTSGYSHVLASEGSAGFELLQKPYSADEITGVLRRAISGAAAATSVKPGLSG
jgi:PAS domain S-box-containing protein